MRVHVKIKEKSTGCSFFMNFLNEKGELSRFELTWEDFNYLISKKLTVPNTNPFKWTVYYWPLILLRNEGEAPRKIQRIADHFMRMERKKFPGERS